LIYLDSSAIMRLVRAEPWSEELRQYLGSVDRSLAYATSAVGFVEVSRVLVRDEEEEVIHRRAATLLAPFARVDLTVPVVEQAGRLPDKHLRALDAIHVASAIQLAPVLEAMVTYDRRMLDAAQFAGLPAVAPGMLS
jgi:predicted nucleic acid-binding protein